MLSLSFLIFGATFKTESPRAPADVSILGLFPRTSSIFCTKAAQAYLLRRLWTEMTIFNLINMAYYGTLRNKQAIKYWLWLLVAEHHLTSIIYKSN